MNENFSEAIKKLTEFNLSIRQQLEIAETFIPTLNHQLAQLGPIGIVGEIMIGGDVIQRRPYTLGPTDSCQFVQAALFVPQGIGVLRRDMEDYLLDQKTSHEIGEDVRPLFVAFEECDSAVKALLVPQIRPLLERLFSAMNLMQR